MRKTLLLRGLYITIIFFSLTLRLSAQELTAEDKNEIRYNAEIFVDELELLYNLITNEGVGNYKRNEITVNSYSSTSGNRIFVNEEVIVEDDIDPNYNERIFPRKDVKIKRYFEDLDLFYKKEQDYTIDFNNILVSEVKQKEYIYLEVYFESEFGSSHIIHGIPYQTNRRVATVLANKTDAGTWKMLIVSIVFYDPAMHSFVEEHFQKEEARKIVVKQPVDLPSTASEKIAEEQEVIETLAQEPGEGKDTLQVEDVLPVETPTLLADSSEESIVTPTESSVPEDLMPFDIVLVEGGTFEMGYKEGRDGEYNDLMDGDAKNLHEVTLSDFYIGRYEVTQRQWIKFMGYNPSGFSPQANEPECLDCPVENITYNEVLDFIAEIKKKTGITFRLPTEAEWEYAARGGSKSNNYLYSGDNAIDVVGWHSKNAGERTNIVGLKKPNELGIYDMTGNVWEWCQDWFGSPYSKEPQDNPLGPSKGRERVIRGGCYYNNSEDINNALRFSESPNKYFEYIGFRLVKDVSTQE